MREMKDSGIEWVGQIPFSWDVKPIRAKFREVTEKNKLGIEKNALKFTYGNIVKKGNFDADDDDYVANTILNYMVVNPGTIILNGLNLNFDFVTQRVALVKERGIITSAYIAFAPILDNDISAQFFTYLLKAYDSCKAFHNMGGGVRKILNFAELKKQYIVYPTITEQKRIADFLDTKCAEIDALTADIQTQIDTLEQYKRSIITEAITKGLNSDAEMKDSGVFYMAPMNAKWRLTKIGYICTKLSRLFKPEDTALICSNSGKVLVRPDDVTGKMVSDDNAMQGIHAGDIAIHGMDTWHGAIALSDYDGKITRVVHVCDSTEDKRFIVYYLQHLAFQGVYKLISNGVRGNTSDFRSWDKVRDIWIAIPKTKEEQKNICDYLDKQCKSIEKVIAEKKEQIEVLNEYKKSLIYEYVTGKKEVPSI